jgi:hypothetical protein
MKSSNWSFVFTLNLKSRKFSCRKWGKSWREFSRGGKKVNKLFLSRDNSCFRFPHRISRRKNVLWTLINCWCLWFCSSSAQDPLSRWKFQAWKSLNRLHRFHIAFPHFPLVSLFIFVPVNVWRNSRSAFRSKARHFQVWITVEKLSVNYKGSQRVSSLIALLCNKNFD